MNRWLLRREADYEMRRDIRIVESLADQRADLTGMKLSRFDKALALNRERIHGVYRGWSAPACPRKRDGTRSMNRSSPALDRGLRQNA